jgi:phosphatidyl-myo-inositol dimannoside synthase
MHRDIVCVFPGMSASSAGGVQASGRIAWQGIAAHLASIGGSAGLVVYGQADVEDIRLATSPACAFSSRWRLLLASAFRAWPARRLLFWHLDLLKLLPILRCGNPEIALFLHGIEAWRPQSWLLHRMLTRVDHFLTNSEYTWERFLESQPNLSSRRHTVIPLGIGDVFSGVLPIPDAEPTVLMLGRLQSGEDYKGHREIITVWPRVRAQVPQARLWIAGDGDLRPELEALAARGGSADLIVFWGRVSEERKAELIGRSRCFAMPSRGEGFGLVYLESMRLGRPCLVSVCDAAREVVDPPEGGLAVDPDRPEELVSSLVRLLTDGPEWMRFSEAARQRYERNFTADHFKRRLVESIFCRPCEAEV